MLNSTSRIKRLHFVAAALLIALLGVAQIDLAQNGSIEVAPSERTAALLRVIENRSGEATPLGLAVSSAHQSMTASRAMARTALAEIADGVNPADSASVRMLMLEGQNLRNAFEALRAAKQDETGTRIERPARSDRGNKSPAAHRPSSQSARRRPALFSRQRAQAFEVMQRVVDVQDAFAQEIGIADRDAARTLLRGIESATDSALSTIRRKQRTSRVIQREVPEVRMEPVVMGSQPEVAPRLPREEVILDRAGTVVTPEITALAASLNNDPLEIYLHVRNNFRFETYFGCLKGAQATLETGAGNDYDLAALTGSLLEAAGYTVRYVRGTAIIPAQAMLEWLGLEDIDAANPILNTAGIMAVPVTSGPTIVHYRVDRLWVEVQTSARPGDDLAWFPLDTAFKRHDLSPGIPGLFALEPFDEATYLSLARKELAYEFYQEQIRAYLEANAPGIGIDEVPLGMTLVPETSRNLPRSVPYQLYSLDTVYSSIPSTLSHKATVRVRYLGSPQFSYQMVLPDTSLQRVTVSYAPSGGNVIPQLKLDGVVVASGGPIPNLASVDLEIEFLLPNGVPDGTEVHPLLAGEWATVGIDAFQISETHIQRQVKSIVDAIAILDAGGTPDDDDMIGAFLYLAHMQYLADVRTADETLAGLAHFKVVHQVKEGVASANTEVYSIGGIPFTTVPGNTVIDVPRLNRSNFALDDDNTLKPELRRLAGINGSAQEHSIWESYFNVPAISTVKSLQLAGEGGIPVFVIDDNDADPNNNCSILCPQLTLAPATETSIANDVAAGNRVMVPRDPTPLLDWSGVGYITESPSGSVGYIISGGLNSASSGAAPGQRPPFATNGGAVAVVLEDGTILWVPVGDVGDGQGTANTGDPVNIANGNFFRDETDFVIPALAEPFGFMRVYNSQSTLDDSLGLGWSHNYSDRIAVQPDMSAIWIDGRGAAHTFQPDVAPGTFISPPGKRETLVDTGSGFTLTRYDGRVQTFDPSGLLLSRADRYGNTYNFGYDGSSRLDTVTDPASRSLTLTYNAANKIATLTDFTARTWTYAYDADDRLMSVTSPSDAQTLALVTQYTYDAAGRLQTITEPNGGVRTIRYYANGRTARVIDPLGNSMDLVYNPWKFETAVKTERGLTEVHSFNQSGNRIALRHPDGTQDTWVWVDNRVTSHTNPLRQTDLFEYDASGNMFRATDATGIETGYQHDPTTANITQITRPGGRVTTLTYDGQGSLFQYLDSENETRTHINNPQGLPTTVTEPGGAVVTLQYNSAGQLTQRDTQLPTTETIVHTARGQVMSRTDANTKTTTHEYDLLDRMISLTDAETYSASLQYDQAGRLIQSTDPRNNPTTYEYDLLNRLARQVNPDGTDLRFKYDEVGNLVTEIDELGRATRYEYDVRNRRTLTRFPDDGLMRMSYDAAGRLSSMQDPLGNTTLYEYDAAGRITRQVDAMSNDVVTTYDINGNPETVTDRAGGVTVLEYDSLNRIIERRGEGGRIETIDYDANGNLLRSVHYDVVGLGSIPDDPRTLPASRQQVTQFTYDVLNRIETETDPEGGVVTYTYDKVGNVTAQEDPRSRTTMFEFDGINRMTKVVRPDTGEALITYDGVGNRTSLTTPRGGTYVWSYDARNRLTSSADPLGLVTRFTYDSVGNLLQQDNPDGSWVRTSYDPLNRAKLVTRSDGTFASKVYDPAGNLLRAGTEKTLLEFGYDSLNRPTSEVLTFIDSAISKAVGYTYDPEGRLATITDPTGRVVTHTRDLAGRLGSVVDSAGHSVGVTFNGYGKREDLTYGNGLVGSHLYDDRGAPTEIDWGTAVAHLVYTRDPAGNPTTITESVDNVSETLTVQYDDLGRPTSVTALNAPGQRSETFAYDLSGNLENPGTGASISYNVADQPTGDGLNVYTHDLLGNRRLAEGPGSQRLATAHDPSSRIRSVKQFTGATLDHEVTYTYDALNRPVEITTDSAVARFVYAFQNRLVEFDAADATVASYLTGQDLDDVFAIATAGSTRYLHRDAIGSVRAMTNAAGAVTGAVNYSLYGRIASTTGSELPALGFAGQPYDSQSGLYNMRARHYDPSTARFLGRDPLSLQPLIPNPYVYAANRPSMFVDPLGLSPSSGWLDGLQFVLDLGGLIPGLGEPLDLLNAGIYTARGDYVNAALSAASAIPLAGYAASAAKGVNRATDVVSAARNADRVADTADAINDASRAADNANNARRASEGLPNGQFRDANGRLRNSDGTFAPDGGTTRRTSDGTHGNTAGDQPATLYERYDADGNFQKHGISQDPSRRYTQAELDGGYLIETQTGPRSEILQIERDLVETNPGPLNKEPWAGSRQN